LTYADGTVYSGDWANDTPNGEGKMTWANGDTYSGTVDLELMKGEGRFVWMNGSTYTGKWSIDELEASLSMIFRSTNPMKIFKSIRGFMKKHVEARASQLRVRCCLISLRNASISKSQKQAS